MKNHPTFRSTSADSTSASTDPAAARVPATVAAARPYVRRKRALAACQFCRLRKTKCDNVRPVCGSCRHHQARCVYTDGSEGDGLQVGLDEAASRHREVLERLDDIRNLLARPSLSDAHSNAVSDTDSPLSVLSTSAGKGLDHEGSGLGAVETESVSDRQPSPSATAYLQYTKCEAILKWPVLHVAVADEDAAINSFIFDAHVLGDGEELGVVPPSAGGSASPASRGGAGQQPKTTPFFGQGVCKQAFVTLCQKFLALVNDRNPILDAHDLLSYARSVAEEGLGWDSKSCVVVSLTPSRPPTKTYPAPIQPPTHDMHRDIVVLIPLRYAPASCLRSGQLLPRLDTAHCPIFTIPDNAP